MKLEYEVDTFMVVMPYFLPNQHKQYMIQVPKVDSWANDGEVYAELSLNFPDGFERVYKWDEEKSIWNLFRGDGEKKLEFPIPVYKQ